MLDTVVTGGVRPSESLRIGLVRLGIPTHTVLQFSSSINLFLEKTSAKRNVKFGARRQIIAQHLPPNVIPLPLSFNMSFNTIS